MRQVSLFLDLLRRRPVLTMASRKMLLVLDLNKTLLCRSKSSRKAARNPRMRPWLGLFLSYLFRYDSPWSVYVWSSARPENVRLMVELCGLRAPLPPSSKNASPPHADQEHSLSDLLETLSLSQHKHHPTSKSGTTEFLEYLCPDELRTLISEGDTFYQKVPPVQLALPLQCIERRRQGWLAC